MKTIQCKLQELYSAEAERLRTVSATAKNDGEYLRPVFGCGNTDSPVMFIGEAPGANETDRGTPFVGKAGEQLNGLLQLADIRRDDIFITNVVKFRPVIRSARSVRNRTPGIREVDDALPLLGREIALIGPRLIITLGNTSLRAVLTLSGEEIQTVGVLHGRAKSITAGENKTVLYPMYHPAGGIYNRSLVAVMEEDATRIRTLVY